MKKLVKENILKILKELKNSDKKWENLNLEELDFEVDSPSDERFGDLTSNISMVLAGRLKENPISLARIIADKLNSEKNVDIDKIEVVLPGYINFYFSKKYLSQQIVNIIGANERWGDSDILKGKSYIFEHSSPNLFKPFHIGHLVNNSIGESLVRIIKKCGAELKVLSFPSDISPGIAKTVWAIKKKGWQNEMTIEKIGEAYVFGTASYKEGEVAKNEIDTVNKILYNQEASEEVEIYKRGQAMSLDYFKEITKRLGSKFDELIFESEAEKVGKEIVKDNVPKIFKDSEGAIIFPGSEYGLFDNVFINSQGFGTYLAKDLGLLKIKFDKSIAITDVEQKEHFKLVKKAGELVNKEWSDKSDFIQHGRLGFLGGKISSRYGNVPLAEDLINQVRIKILDKVKEQDFPQEEKNDIAEKVSISALKYSILKSGAGKNITFDFEKATAFEGDTGPYLQYALVRTNSILKNAEEKNISIEIDFKERIGEIPLVEKMILKFPEMIEKSFIDNSPHHLVNYLYRLASEFSSFYGQTKVIDLENPDLKNNIALVRAIQITLRNGLDLLGIEQLKRM